MNALTVSVIVPTFREAENIPVLVPRIAAALEKAGLSGEIIIVDDNSPDATSQVCAELSAKYPVHLEIRTSERGLSSAVIHGLRQAKGDFLVVMDADLSHPAEKIPELVQALRNGADFVIGSRYVQGGGTAEGWGLFRWLNSKAATVMAWPLSPASDPMAGFFGLSRTTFAGAANLDPVGYKIGLELIVKCACKNIQEVPILFENRLHGSSKLSLKEQINYLRHLKRLYEFKFGESARLAQFLMVGGTGMIVDLMFFFILLQFLPLGGARALTIGIAMTWNFWLNRRITFSYASTGNVVTQYILFCLSCGLGALVNWSVSVVFASMFEPFPGQLLIGAVLGIVAGSVFNFILCNNAVFRRRPSVESAVKVTAMKVEVARKEQLV